MRKIAPILLLLACAESSELPAPRGDLSYSQILEYVCAAKNKSTAPSYLWINARSEGSGERWSLVIESTAWPSAENHDPNEDFRATQSSGVLTPNYSRKDVIRARLHLEPMSDSEILARFGRGEVGGGIGAFAPQEALAHALFERGFYPGRGDITPVLFVSSSPCADAEREIRTSLRYMREAWQECMESCEEVKDHP